MKSAARPAGRCRRVLRAACTMLVLSLLAPPGGPHAAPGEPARLLDPIPGERAAHGFSLPDTGGRMHSMEDYGGRLLLVAFWSSTCPICLNDLNNLEIAYRFLRDSGFDVVAIHAGGTASEVGEFIKTTPVSYTVLVDSALKMGEWGIPAVPTVYLVSPRGHLLYRAVGARDWGAPPLLDQLQAIVRRHRGGKDEGNDEGASPPPDSMPPQ
ncbi:MAG: TlpA disulfide reductase family protein [Gammaproteobacteria bacterium]|nr:TlpA disulfide reductase family protein [Gammaproteobacteria bacterium]